MILFSFQEKHTECSVENKLKGAKLHTGYKLEVMEIRKLPMMKKANEK